MMASRSAPLLDFNAHDEKPNVAAQGGVSRLDGGEGKEAGAMCRVGDTRLGEMFVRDRLTTGPAGKSSPLVELMPQNRKPLSKYDPNTGKFYRSTVVDASAIPASLSAVELLQIFSANERLAYRAETHTGTIVSLAGSALTLTCVGETHVDADRMFAEVQDRLSELLIAPQEVDVTLESAMGMSFFNAGHGPVEKEVELVAESCSGFSLFAPAQPMQHRPIKADTCGGMTMFSWDVDESELSGDDTEDEESTGVFSSVGKMLANTVAGMTFFRAKKQTVEDLRTTETMGGLTLYLGDGKRMQNVCAETCGGITTFSECADEASAVADEEEIAPFKVASDSMMGFTDFTPLLRSMQQDPDSYTDEQKWMSDLAWGIC